MKGLNEFNTLKDLAENDGMLSSVTEWLVLLMIPCKDRADNHCTLAHRPCEYETCPGNNPMLNGG